MFHSYLDSPIGELLLTGSDAGITGLYLARYLSRPVSSGARDDAAFADTRHQLIEYFAGNRVGFDVPLAVAGTDFQRRVWRLFEQIEYGTSRSFGELARELGNPRAAQAIGTATGRNPISILIPCHRVVAASRAGPGAEPTNKDWLLQHERAIRARRHIAEAGPISDRRSR